MLHVLQLISLSDLENDFVNPHDASAALNKWTVRSLSGRLCMLLSRYYSKLCICHTTACR